MSSDTLRRLANILRRKQDATGNPPTVNTYMLALMFEEAADELDAEPPESVTALGAFRRGSDKAEPQPASPNVREACECLATFAEDVAIAAPPFNARRISDTAARLAKEARAALAEPETPGIVAELVNLCESSRNILAAVINGMHPDDPACVELQRRLAEVIAKGKSHG